jgi:hypothetical protein
VIVAGSAVQLHLEINPSARGSSVPRGIAVRSEPHATYWRKRRNESAERMKE